MSPMFTSFKEYAKTMERRSKKLKNSKGVSRTAKFMLREAIKRAPRRTGETIKGLQAKKVRDNEWQVVSSVRPKGTTGFRQNMWTNRSPPYDRPRMYWNKNRMTMYGDGSHRITGTPGWFTISALLTARRFPKFTQGEVRRVISSK